MPKVAYHVHALCSLADFHCLRSRGCWCHYYMLNGWSLLDPVGRFPDVSVETTTSFFFSTGRRTISRRFCGDIPCFIAYCAPNGTIMYKMNIMLYWRRPETSDHDHKLIRKLFTEEIHKVRSPISPISFMHLASFCNQWSCLLSGYFFSDQKLHPYFVPSLVILYLYSCENELQNVTFHPFSDRNGPTHASLCHGVSPILGTIKTWYLRFSTCTDIDLSF